MSHDTLFACDKSLRARFDLQEDFQSLTYGFKLSCDVTDHRVMGMLREVEEDVSKTIRVRRACNWCKFTNCVMIYCTQSDWFVITVF